MRRPRNRKPYAIAMLAVVLVASIAGYVIHDTGWHATTDEQTRPVVSQQTTETTRPYVEAPATTDPRDNYEATTWNPSEYPNMYRIDGAAIIPANDLEPGDIEYEYDPTTHTQRASALLDHSNYEYGQRERESISDIEPLGWPEHNGEVDVTFPDGDSYHGWFWNRSHLIAHSLGGEASERNLVTGTRAQNVGQNDMHGGMQYAEQIASNYLKADPSRTLYYFVTPVYENGENIPRSVYIDMRSDDASINMHIEVFNAMPGYDIDYVNGTWS